VTEAAPDIAVRRIPLSTLAFDRFVAPARHRPQIWRLVLGLVVSFVVYTLWVFVTLALAYYALAPGGDAVLWVSRLVEATTVQGTLILLATFGGMALGPMAAARWLHKRSAAGLFGPRVRVLRDFVTAAAIVFTVLGVSVLFWSFSYDAVPNLSWTTWLAVLPLTLLGLLVQTGAEEVLFRGYLQSQLAARFRSPIVWLILPSLVFGIVHLDPAMGGDSAWLIVGAAGIFGLVAADLTARTGSIGAAWGFHFANNTMAIAVLSTDGTITGLSRYLTPYTLAQLDGTALLVAADIFMMLVAWLLVRRAVGR